MYLTLVTKPTKRPVSLSEVKDYCHIETSDDDRLLESFLVNAIEVAEATTGRKLVSQVWRYDIDKFQTEILLPYPQLISVDSIQYYDTANELQTLSTSYYDVHGVGHIGTIKEAYGYSFPGVYPRERAVQITFTCGYTSVTEIPEGIKNGIKAIVQMFYDGRGDQFDSSMANFLFGAHSLRGFM